MRAVVVGLLSGLFLSAGPALADPPAHARETVRLPEKVIYGSPQRPSVVYVLPRSKVPIRPMELRASFVDRIVRAASTEPLQ